MPVFSDSATITTQHESSWDAYIRSDQVSTNYSTLGNVKCSFQEGRGGNTAYRTILAFDLSDLANRNITACTLTLKTTSGVGAGSSATVNIYKLTGTVDRANVTWQARTLTANWSTAGGDFSTSPTATIDWPNTNDQAFTSNDLKDLLSGEEGGMVYLIIKSAESTGVATKNAIAHDEGDSEVVDNVPLLTVTSTIDHKYLWNRHQMTKFMNKSRGLIGKSTIPSVGNR